MELKIDVRRNGIWASDYYYFFHKFTSGENLSEILWTFTVQETVKPIDSRNVRENNLKLIKIEFSFN